MPITYSIVIDEAQRLLLVHALGLELNESGAEDAEELLQLLQALPKIEAEEPRVTHGLCF